MYKIAVIGGGAAGFFFAINRAMLDPEAKITIYEQSKDVLGKVKISGGGRCNVTHACWEPKELAAYYPRGEKELLGPFHKFACGDTVSWFETQGVPLKIEADGRMFPEANKSQAIIDCFMHLCDQYGISVKTQSKIKHIQPSDKGGWSIEGETGPDQVEQLFLGTGSSTFFWNILRDLGHDIVPPVPSLFTFNISDERIQDLPGLSVPQAQVSISSQSLAASGPLLITHWGLSGPAILKLSAWGARVLADMRYAFEIKVDWVPQTSAEEISNQRAESGSKTVLSKGLYDIPLRLWRGLLSPLKLSEEQRWADLNKDQMAGIIYSLKSSYFMVNGKSTFKDEFVTAGGVNLKQVNFKNFSSKLLPNIYMAGEVLDIDAITGGFNFQAAWTGAYLAAADAYTP